jgi:hypothetical protein
MKTGQTVFSEMNVTVRLGLVRKIKLGKDLDKIQAALARIYTGACHRALAGKTT